MPYSIFNTSLPAATGITVSSIVPISTTIVANPIITTAPVADCQGCYSADLRFGKYYASPKSIETVTEIIIPHITTWDDGSKETHLSTICPNTTVHHPATLRPFTGDGNDLYDQLNAVDAVIVKDNQYHIGNFTFELSSTYSVSKAPAQITFFGPAGVSCASQTITGGLSAVYEADQAHATEMSTDIVKAISSAAQIYRFDTGVHYSECPDGYVDGPPDSMTGAQAPASNSAEVHKPPKIGGKPQGHAMPTATSVVRRRGTPVHTTRHRHAKHQRAEPTAEV